MWQDGGTIERVTGDDDAAGGADRNLTLRRANWGPLKAVRGRLSSLAAFALLHEESEEFAEAEAAAADAAAAVGLPPIVDNDAAPLDAVLSPGACFFGFLVRGPGDK